VPEKFGQFVGLLRREPLVRLPALGRFRGQPLGRQRIGFAADRGVLLAVEPVAAGADCFEIIGGADHRQRYAGRPVAKSLPPTRGGVRTYHRSVLLTTMVSDDQDRRPEEAAAV
jgi:hypothetical protein